MKLHLSDFWHHHPVLHHEAPALHDSPDSPDSHNLLYTAILVIGVPATVVATLFVVRHLYDGVMWLLPT